MKVLILNGSPRVGGNKAIALDEMVKVFEKDGRASVDPFYQRMRMPPHYKSNL